MTFISKKLLLASHWVFVLIFFSFNSHALEATLTQSIKTVKPLPFGARIYSESLQNDKKLIHSSKAQFSLNFNDSFSIYALGGVDSQGTLSTLRTTDENKYLDKYFGLGLEYTISTTQFSLENRLIQPSKGKFLNQNRFLMTSGYWKEFKFNNLLSFLDLYNELSLIRFQSQEFWGSNTFLPRLGFRQNLYSFWSIDEMIELHWKIQQGTGSKFQSVTEPRLLVRGVYFHENIGLSLSLGANLTSFSQISPYALFVLDWKFSNTL